MNWIKKVKAALERACPDCYKPMTPVVFECLPCKAKWNAISAKEIQLAAELKAAREALNFYAETPSIVWGHKAQLFFEKFPET